MEKLSQSHSWRKKKWLNILFFCLIAVFIVFGGLFLSQGKTQGVEETEESLVLEQPFQETENNSFAIVQGNSILPVIQPPHSEPKVIQRFRVVLTGYSSSPHETDDTPYTTAAGTSVRDGIIANNLLPFGTKVKIPEIYGEKIFVVEDRMSRKKGYYHVDIWFPSYWEAKQFGAKRTYIEVLEG